MPQADEQFKSSVESVENKLKARAHYSQQYFLTNESNRRKDWIMITAAIFICRLRGMTMDNLQKIFDDHIANRTL